MTTPERTPARRRRPRATALSGLIGLLGAAAVLVLGLGGPAAADTPVGWSDPAPVSPLHGLTVVFLIPFGIALVILALVYLPPLLRGERVAPGAPPIQNQWLGGPAKSAGELAAPDGEASQAGGASARW